MPTIIPREDVQHLVQTGAQVVDVLSPREYGLEHLPGAVNVPLREFTRERVLQALDRSRPVIVYCHDYQ